jgi:hypothetical protein
LNGPLVQPRQNRAIEVSFRSRQKDTPMALTTLFSKRQAVTNLVWVSGRFKDKS